MTNYRLRNAMASRQLTNAALAERVGVDPKSVERWITQDRMPHSPTRLAAARVLGYDETYFWPALLGEERMVGTASAELVQVWPARSTVPGDVWEALIAQTGNRLEVLVYAAAFLIETHGLPQVLRQLSDRGGAARILLGDSADPLLAQRGVDENLPNLPGRAASALEYLGDVPALPGIQVRLHATPLYVSLFRFADTLMVNAHTHGVPAKDSPVLQLAKVPGGALFHYYEQAFDRVWAAGRTVG